VGAVIVLAAVAAGLWRTGDPDDAAEPAGDDVAEAEPADSDTDWDDVRDDLGVTPAEFERRWNEAVDALGAGYRVGGDPTEVDSGFHDLPARVYQLELGRAEVVLTPERDLVVGVTVEQATPAGPQQATELRRTVTAALSAASGLSPDQAEQRLAGDLGFSDEQAAAEHHGEVAQISDVTAGMYIAHGTWEFYVQKPASS
jgi:hypothetical protein